MVPRPEEEWIEVKGCTPRIINEATWRRVQDILADPERISRRSTGRYYALRSRTKCGLCGSAMVGQTLPRKESRTGTTGAGTPMTKTPATIAHRGQTEG